MRSASPVPVWFDAHLDLAYLAVNRRDMRGTLDELNANAGARAAIHPPAAVSLPALAEGGVRFALATIFTESVATRAECDAPEKYVGLTEQAHARIDADAIADAHRAGRAQLEVYLSWQEQGLVSLDLRQRLRQAPGTGEVRGGMGVAEPVAPDPRRLVERALVASASAQSLKGPPLHLGILMENADPIREPSEVGWWKERGLVAVGLTWSRASRYAGGNATTLGLSDEGRALVRELTRQRVLLDVSHLSDRAFDDLLEVTDRPVMASHSNSRAVLTSTPEFRNAFSNHPSELPPEVLLQRHLTDDQIRRIIERGGVIGLNLYRPFIDPAIAKGQRPSVTQALAHARHICRIAESVPSVADPRWHVGLGSDMDGGFSAEGLPSGINAPRDLIRLIEALAADGWSDGDLFNFACGNWVRLMNRVL